MQKYDPSSRQLLEELVREHKRGLTCAIIEKSLIPFLRWEVTAREVTCELPKQLYLGGAGINIAHLSSSRHPSDRLTFLQETLLRRAADELWRTLRGDL